MALPADITKALKDAFDMFDGDKDGRVTHAELAKVLNKLNINANQQVILDMITSVDKDGSGTVEFQEFVDALTPCLTRKETDSEMMNAFREFDEDGNGFIEADELKQKLQEMSGESVTDAEVADMIKQVDVNGDGKIDFEEFKKLMADN